MAVEITLIIKTRESELLWNDFRKAIQETVSAMGDVGENLVAGKLSGNWRIDKLSMDSPTTVKLRYETEDHQDIPQDWMKMYVVGMEQLEQGEQQPRGFNESALRHVSKLESLGERIESIEYVAASERVTTSLRAAEHATVVHKDIKRPARMHSYGELRGTLGQITVHESKSEFAIYDPITDQPIHCTFAPEHAPDVAKLLTKRVAVYGRITYFKGRPSKVEVESWKPLKSQDELASLKEIRKVMTPLPEGISSEDYIRSQRDDD